MRTSPIKNILCPVDLSETSGRALAYARMLASWYDASVTALQVIWVGIPPVSPSGVPSFITDAQQEDFEQDLKRFVENARRSPQVNIAVLHGPIVPQILREAKVLNADLIVMGTHGLGGFERLVLGSVTEKVLRKAECPVLTVPPASADAPTIPQPFKCIVCAIDFSPASEKALAYALRLAEESGKRLVLLHVVDWPTDRHVPPGRGPEMSAERHQYEHHAIKALRASVSEDARQWCTCQERTATGRPHEEIVRIAAAESADLIVMGVHGRQTLDQMMFGSTTSHVVRSATCPVLTIR